MIFVWHHGDWSRPRQTILFHMKCLVFLLAFEQKSPVFVKEFIHANFSQFLYFYILPSK